MANLESEIAKREVQIAKQEIQILKVITIFGGSEPRAGDPPYEEARRLGGLLAAAGFAVLSGGYIGTMEAVSRGAAENGGHVIGVTCDDIEAFRPVGANPWVKEERRTANLRERIFTMITACQAAIALPGGSGTLAEMSLMWNLLYIKAVPPRPLILVGPAWQETMRLFIRNFNRYIPESQSTLLQFAPTVDAAVALLDQK
jgi:uncharacterized protein (TIGR00730 family)